MAVPASVFNQLFAQSLDSQEGREKIAQYGGTYVRDRLREVSFARKVLPPETVTRSDCQRSVNHDTLVKIVDIEPRSRATSLTFRGQPTARFIRAPKYEIPFFTISSEKFEKVEQELLAYEMPITKVIEDNSVKDIQTIEDRHFMLYISAAVDSTMAEAFPGASGYAAIKFNATNVNGGFFPTRLGQGGSTKIKGELALSGANDFVVHPVQRNDLVNLFKLLNGAYLRANRILITETDFDDFLQWTLQDAGDKVQSETLVDGYKYPNVLGKLLIRTVKTDILRPGNIYCFTDPKFIGNFFVLNATKFYIDKIANLITWQSWEDIGIGIGNIRSIVKLELYGGAVNINATGGATQGRDTGFAAADPEIERNLGAENNRADQGLTYPVVNQF
jgi:hypothetical protein